MYSIWVIVLAYCSLIAAQFPPEPEQVTILRSRFNANVTVSYKENSICETTPGVRSFAGYVHIPPYALAEHGVSNQSWPINTFFWFFEARHVDPRDAPLLIWINGGPGSSSSGAALSNAGPCTANPDANSTYLNEWSWNNNANLMFVDQPVQVGLSYDTLQNITYDRMNGNLTLLQPNDPIPAQNTTLLVGTWPSTNPNTTSLGSIDAAYAMWHFAQAWFQEFPEHKATSVSLSGVSYGGKFAPAIFNFFEEQNEKIRNETWNVQGEQFILPLDTLIIDSGCMDLPASYFAYPEMAVNNTYGIRAVNDSVIESMLHALNDEDGCLERAYHCGNLTLQYDPLNLGLNETVNMICEDASDFCHALVQGPYYVSGRSFYDITVPEDFSGDPPFHAAFMQRSWVQEELGTRVNWTGGSRAVGDVFNRVGDFARPGWVGKLAYLLEKGVKVAFVYGDRDYICNWIGGEAISLTINYTHTADFHAAGYEDIHTNDSYIGGSVRQYGNLSFSRVYQAIHGVTNLQPETSFKIIDRAMRNVDIATGTVPVRANDGNVYSSRGPKDTFGIKNKVLPIDDVLQVCYLMDVDDTCTDAQKEMISNGTALIKDYMIVDKNSSTRYPDIVGPWPAQR